MTKYFKANNDTMFKTIFCDINNRDLLETLIKEAIKIDNLSILDVSVKELPKNNIYHKGKTLDVLVETNHSKINIEINNYSDPIFHRRNFSYLSQLYLDDVKVGEDYSKMNNFIQINLTTSKSSLIPDYDIYVLSGKRHRLNYIDNFTIYEFNLLKMKEACYNEYKFLKLLDCDKDALIQDSKGDKMMEKLKDEVERLNSNKEFVEFMSDEEEYQKCINTERSLGYQEGIEQGIIQIARKLLDLNFNISDIVKATGLSEEQIKNIKE